MAQQDPLFLRTAEMIAKLLCLHLTNEISREEKEALEYWLSHQPAEMREAIRRFMEPARLARDFSNYKSVDVEGALRDVQWKIFLESLMKSPKE